jgi:hypothetical protein
MSMKNAVLKSAVAVAVVGANVAWLAHEHVKPIADVYYTSSEALYPSGMPKIVYVDGVRWQIETGWHDEEMEAVEAFGLTQCDIHVIHLHSNLTETQQRDTLLHELMHAHVCDATGKIDNDAWIRSGGHGTIAKFAQFFPALMRTNPELARFMLVYKGDS